MTSSNDKIAAVHETVLIVDDDNDTVLCFKAIVESAGYRAITAESGGEAIKIVKSVPVDMVLMDIFMPGIDGVTAAGHIKEFVGMDDFLPILLVTAFPEERTKVAGLGCADGFIAKPVSNAELVATVRSLLKIRHLNHSLARSKETYKKFFDNFPYMTISVRADGTVVGCNKLFCEFYHTTKAEVEGMSIFSIIRLESDKDYLPRFLETVATADPAPLQHVFEFNMPGSAERYKINIRANVIDDVDGGITIVMTLEDVTAQYELEIEKKVARRHLYRSAHLASIGTLASGLSHELNNPLTAILGFSSALFGRAEKNEEIDKDELTSYLQIIHQEAIRCRDIIDHLHRFARDTGETRLASVSLGSCVANALSLVNMKAARSSITIRNEIAPDVRAWADANKLEQVFINLLNNCIDFCGAGASVTVSIVPEKKASRFVLVSVRDDGPGMSEEVLAKAFDPFFTTKEVGRGIGMGLAISHRIMEELQGRIDLFSEPGKGTTTVLELPADRGGQDMER